MRKPIIVMALLILLNAVMPCAGAASGEKTLNPLAALAVAWIFDFTELEQLTGGFVVRESLGIFSVEKFYEKDGVELRLLGMAHVAGSDFYQDIKSSLANKPAIMLMEGVTDEKNLLQTPPDYGSVAKNLGLASQRDKFSPEDMPENVDIIRADLDTADFSGETVDILNFIGSIYGKDGINFSRLLMMYMKLADIENSRAFLGDLITKRNQCLLQHIKTSMQGTRLIVVPWGAMHLPQIEKWARAEGFVFKQKKSRPVIRFPEYFKFFLQKKTPEDSSNGKTLHELLGI